MHDFFPRHFPFHHKDSVELKVCQVLEEGKRFVHPASRLLFVTMFISLDFNLQTQESASLPRSSKSTNSKIPECLVFRPTTGRSLSPEFKRSAAQLLPHQLDDFTGAESKLTSDGVERGPIFPCHLNNPV